MLSAAGAGMFTVLLALVETNLITRQEAQIRNGIFVILPLDTVRWLQTGFIGIPGRPYLSVAAVVAVGIGLILAYLLTSRRFWSALLLVAAPCCAGGLAGLLKTAIVRPGGWSPDAHTFPSGHSAFSFGLYLALWYLLCRGTLPRAWKRTAIGLVVALLCLATLSTLTFHLPTELLAGWAVAATWFGLLLGALARQLDSEVSAFGYLPEDPPATRSRTAS